MTTANLSGGGSDTAGRVSAQAGWTAFVPGALAVLAVLIVNAHVLAGSFLFDDYVHLFAVTDLPFQQAIGHSGTQHLLHSYKFVIWSLHAVSGVNAFGFFLFALVLHLVNVGMFYSIALRLTGQTGLAALGAGVWGMGPVIAGTLGWISVHGQLYATSAVLWILLDLVRYRESPALPGNGVLVRHAVLLLFAGTCFGTGLGLALALSAAVFLWNPVPRRRNALLAVYALVAVLLVLLYLYSGVRGDAPDPLSKILQRGVSGLLVPLKGLAELLSVSAASFLTGPWLLGEPGGVESPVPAAVRITLFAALPLTVLGFSFADAPTRRALLALMLLSCAAYGLVALGRTTSILGFRPEQLRFHYAGQVPLSFVLLLSLSVTVTRLPQPLLRLATPLCLVLLLASIFPFYKAMPPPMKEKLIQQQERQYARSIKKIDKAVRAQAGQGEIRIPNEPFKVFAWAYTPDHFPGLAALYVISYPESEIDGKRVYFLEPDRVVVDMYRKRTGSRIAELLVFDPGAWD